MSKEETKRILPEEDTHKYIECMVDIKQRLNFIHDIFSGKKTTGYRITDAELLCLQFRKIFENIIFASLASHRKHYEKLNADFHKHWNIRIIMREIERINTNYYPRPSYPVHDPITGAITQERAKEGGFLTKQDLIKCWDRCGKLLHAPNPYRPVENLNQYAAGFPKWYEQVIQLLDHHQISFVDESKQLWVTMDGGDGKVNATEMRRVRKATSKELKVLEEDAKKS